MLAMSLVCNLAVSNDALEPDRGLDRTRDPPDGAPPEGGVVDGADAVPPVDVAADDDDCPLT